MCATGVEPLRDDRDLRRLHLERLELSGATLRILRRHRISHDSHWRIVGHDPFGDPELPFGLLFILSIAHRDIDRLAGVGQVDDELGRPIALARRRIECVHPEANRLAALELIVQETVARMTGRIEEDGVPKDAQTLTTGLTGKGRRSQRRKQDQCGGSECVSHVGQGIGTCGVCPTNPPR